MEKKKKKKEEEKKKREERIIPLEKDLEKSKEQPKVVLVILDSLSRASVRRSLPKTGLIFLHTFLFLLSSMLKVSQK